MRVIIKVYDKRCDSGINTRGRNFTDIKDALQWVRNVKNKASEWVTVIDEGRAYNTILK